MDEHCSAAPSGSASGPDPGNRGGQFGADAYDRNLFAEYARKCGGLFLVVVRRTKVCALLDHPISPGRIGNRAELVSMAVAPAFLARVPRPPSWTAPTRLRRRRIARLGLMVKVTNQRARAFYAKYRFRQLRRVPGYYEDGADGLSLAKNLRD